MTPVLWWNYPVGAVTALLSGMILATFVRTSAAPGAECYPFRCRLPALTISMRNGQGTTP